MKYKVGDKVRIKSKEWWDAQPKNESGGVDCGADIFTDFMTCLCGKIVEISDILEDGYSIKIYGLNWTDEMFDDSFSYNSKKSTISKQMIKDIAEVIKKHNFGVYMSENDGKIIIEPLKVEEDLPIDTPVMCSQMDKDFCLRYYAGNKLAFTLGNTSKNENVKQAWNYIIPCDKFNFENPEESLKYNIVKK